MHALAGVFFHVQPGDAYTLACPSLARDVDVAVFGQRLVILRNLVALGQIGIEVVLAREDGGLADAAVQCHRGADGVFDRFAIQHRKGSRESQAYRADVRIWGRSELRGAATEYLGYSEQLDVNFEPNHCFVSRKHVRRNRGDHCARL